MKSDNDNSAPVIAEVSFGSPKLESDGTGRLAQNITYFARALREAGMPVGPGSILDALAAVEAAQIGDKRDFYATLQSVFVKKREHMILFAQAFEIFWKRRGFMDKLIALLSPKAPPTSQNKNKSEAGASRTADALLKTNREDEKPAPSLDLDARFTTSTAEMLQRKDFAQMSANEIHEAMRLVSKLRLPLDEVETRRYRADAHGKTIDLRGMFKRSLRPGGAIDLAYRSRRLRHPPIVAICDISGSMSEYSRIFLHFLHALTEERGRVHTFLFGTRLTNVSRALRSKDIDEALAQCSGGVQDWSGGTRIGTSLHRFNRDWSRRVLGQGAIVLLFTDGLERDGAEDLAREMERLHKSCRRLIWLNPLLRYDGFTAKALGIRTILPHVDEFRSIHSLNSMKQLIAALSAKGKGIDSHNPRLWLKRAS